MIKSVNLVVKDTKRAKIHISHRALQLKVQIGGSVGVSVRLKLNRPNRIDQNQFNFNQTKPTEFIIKNRNNQTELKSVISVGDISRKKIKGKKIKPETKFGKIYQLHDKPSIGKSLFEFLIDGFRSLDFTLSYF